MLKVGPKLRVLLDLFARFRPLVAEPGPGSQTLPVVSAQLAKRLVLLNELPDAPAVLRKPRKRGNDFVAALDFPLLHILAINRNPGGREVTRT